jgi:hypothetical protein
MGAALRTPHYPAAHRRAHRPDATAEDRATRAIALLAPRLTLQVTRLASMCWIA